MTQSHINLGTGNVLVLNENAPVLDNSDTCYVSRKIWNGKALFVK